MENNISKVNCVLIVLTQDLGQDTELKFLMQNFCGRISYSLSEIKTIPESHRVYFCGDVNKLDSINRKIYVIKEFSCNYNQNTENFLVIELGQVPIVIHDAGIFFRKLFSKGDYFIKIKSEHKFQELTESTKASTALRKGIYITEILKAETDDKSELLHFHLLRCSSNFSGPTDNFRDTDLEIVEELNNLVKLVFEKEIKVNHVLAQIYENKKKTHDKEKEVKSKIKAHSDKTKDMPKEGVIAFCTFYDFSKVDEIKISDIDRFDMCYKQTSILTKLHFKLKNTVSDDTLVKEFSVTLYPNSAFIIPLSTNRLYTHEIKPSVLNVDRIPVRMGYVARCSNLEAVYTNGKAYIKENGRLIELEKMTQEMQEDLRNTYYKENISEQIIEYGKVYFSMNMGDYEKPIY